jgi:phosphoribosylaminoimidazolecarboxamide formyltransferase / IMP cyclohydrolase
MVIIKRALLSVTDKTGLTDIARALASRQVTILSTGGTARALRSAGIPVTDVSEYTGFPEMMDGRIKTLHPKIHGALLGRRSHPDHVEQMRVHAIEPIDMLIVNLYAFEKTVARPGCTFADAIENIDIGGPAMLRSAAKNFEDVTVVIDPADYPRIIREMDHNGGSVSKAINLDLARKVFTKTAAYDAAISTYLSQATMEE